MAKKKPTTATKPAAKPTKTPTKPPVKADKPPTTATVATTNGSATEEPKPPKAKQTTLREFLFQGIALVSVGFSAALFVIEEGWLVTLVSGVCSFLGPTAAMMQTRLTDLQYLRQLQNHLRSQVNRFSREIAQLKKENAQLAKSAKRLKEVEANLAALTKVQGQSIDVFMKQMDEYRKLQTKIQESLQAKIIQNLIEVVFISDNDKDFVLGKSEVDGLLHRLKSIEGVNFSEANFKRAIEKAGFDFDTVMKEQGGFDLTAVIHVVENLLDDNVPEKDNIFQIDTQQLLPTPIRTNLRNKSKRK